MLLTIGYVGGNDATRGNAQGEEVQGLRNGVQAPQRSADVLLSRMQAGREALPQLPQAIRPV